VGIVGKRGLLQKIFTLRPLEWVGARSYGLYLWHWPLLIIFGVVFAHSSLWWIVPVATIATTFVIAAVSYRFIEMPIRELGLRTTLRRAIRRYEDHIDDVTVGWRRRPHIAVFPVLAGLVLTVLAIVGAPTKTSAEIIIEAGEHAVAHAKTVSTQKTVDVTPSPVKNTIKPKEVSGDTMTLVGDSVSLASAPSLQAHFPGILIDAHISRSLREGGFDTINQLEQSGQLRHTVIIALATNGYYGTGNLDKLIAQLAGHNIVLVTAYGDREWINPDDVDARAAANKYPNVAVADWAIAIASHTDLLSSDGIHPTSAGGDIYSDSIAAALKKFE
jgi:hypothetical protein